MHHTKERCDYRYFPCFHQLYLVLHNPVLQLLLSPWQAESLEPHIYVHQNSISKCGLPQLSVPEVQVDVASNTSPATLKIEEVQQRIMYPLGSFILPLAIRSAAAMSCMNLSKPVLLLLLLL